MFEKLEQELKKIIELVKLCPANLQEKCFEVLLIKILDDTDTGKRVKSEKQKKEVPEEQDEIKKEDGTKEEEIKLNDLHVKARKLLGQNLSLSDINNAFYKDGEEIKPLFDDLKSSKISESQIKLALLEAFKNGIKTGDFKFDTTVVKQQCEIYKCYDAGNFAAYFRNRKDLFGEEYARNSVMSLSSEGKKELVNLIKELVS
jgi:hypothetical protein